MSATSLTVLIIKALNVIFDYHASLLELLLLIFLEHCTFFTFELILILLMEWHISNLNCLYKYKCINLRFYQFKHIPIYKTKSLKSI